MRDTRDVEPVREASEDALPEIPWHENDYWNAEPDAGATAAGGESGSRDGEEDNRPYSGETRAPRGEESLGPREAENLPREEAGAKQPIAVDKTEAGAQTVIPGAEKIGQGALAQRRADASLKAKAPQLPLMAQTPAAPNAPLSEIQARRLLTAGHAPEAIVAMPPEDRQAALKAATGQKGQLSKIDDETRAKLAPAMRHAQFGDRSGDGRFAVQ